MATKRGKVYTIIVQPANDPEFEGYYNASVPALPGCFSCGASREEALANIKEAIELYLGPGSFRRAHPCRADRESRSSRVMLPSLASRPANSPPL